MDSHGIYYVHLDYELAMTKEAMPDLLLRSMVEVLTFCESFAEKEPEKYTLNELALDCSERVKEKYNKWSNSFDELDMVIILRFNISFDIL